MKTSSLTISVALLAFLMGVLSALTSWLLIPLLFLGVVFVFLFFRKPAAVLLLFVFLRPTLEAFNDVKFFSIGPLEFNPNWILAFLIIALGVAHVVRNRVDLFKYSVSFPYLLFIAVCVLSLVETPYLNEGIVDVLRFLTIFLILFLVAEFCKGEESGLFVANIVIYSSLLPLVAGLLQLATGQGRVGFYITRIYGLSGPVGHSNFLMVVAVLGIILFMHYQSKWRRLFYGTVILTSIVSMIYTFTRSTYVGLAVSLFIIGFFRYRKILAVLAVLFLLVVVNPIFSMRFGVLLGGESGDLSMELRMSLWSRMRDYILSSPVLGHGIGSFAPSSEKYAGFYMTSHSGFIKIFSEVGLLGLLLYFWVLLDLLKKCYLVYTKDESPFYRNMALVCFTLLVSNILINLVQNTFSMPVYQLAIWALFGIIYSTSSARQHKP